MSASGALAALDAHLVAAGATISPAIANVAQGERVNSDRRIDYWCESIGDPERFEGAETFTDRMFGVPVTVRLYLPVRDSRTTLTANIEADLVAVSLSIATRVMGDYTMGGECVATTWGGTTFGWVDRSNVDNGTWLRTSTSTFTFDFVEQITLAP